MKFIYVFFLSLALCILRVDCSNGQSSNNALRLAVAGATHGHVGWILGRKDKSDVSLVGVYEPDTELAKRYIKQYNLGADIFYTDLAKMLETVKPEAVVAFGSIYEHMAVVEACAPRSIHVMVEKPLATTNAHAARMEELAKKHKIYLLTNYETSWYPMITLRILPT